jgi:SAM-dependent methyltransferase
MNDYDEKLRREKAWYSGGFNKGHFLNSPLFFSDERTAFNTKFVKERFAESIRAALAGCAKPRMLIAPTGGGYDLPYLLPLADKVVGVDIAEDALALIEAPALEKHVGDIKNMHMLASDSFDVVVMSEFFHHFLQMGFDDFLLEAKRVLRPGGHLFAFEPNILHPMCFAASIGKKLAGNITGAVEDESPFFPPRLTRAMRRCGFADVRLSAASYSHNRMPIFLARIIHAVTRPLLNAPVLKNFGWCCTFYGRKP